MHNYFFGIITGIVFMFILFLFMIITIGNVDSVYVVWWRITHIGMYCYGWDIKKSKKYGRYEVVWSDPKLF